MSATSKKSRRKEYEEAAQYKAATEGGEVDDWLETLTPIGKAFNDDFLTKRNYNKKAEYNYTSKNGELISQAIRYEHRFVEGEKRFVQRHANPEMPGDWLFGAPLKVIYRWQALAKADDDALVIYCEGEKDADRLASLGFVTTTVAGQVWTANMARAFRDRDVLILEDADEDGRENAIAAKEALQNEAKSIRIVRLPKLRHGEDVSDWLDAGHTKEELVAIIEAAPVPRPMLSFIDFSSWVTDRAADQKWAVPDRFPAECVTLFSGAGSMGKSYALLQLGVAHALEQEWLGIPVPGGSAIVIDCEDPNDVFHRRLDGILEGNYRRYSNMIGRLYLESWAGQDAVLGFYNRRTSKIEPTPLYYKLLEMACDIRPVTIAISSASHVFAGSEIDRTQVQQFIGLLHRIGIASGAGIDLSAHPSLTGISSGSGLSGSTQWHNGVRARAVLKGVGDDGEGRDDMTPKNDFRIIEFYKNNYGALTGSVTIKYQNGLFVPVTVTEADQVARNTYAEEVFMNAMTLLLGQRQVLSPSQSSPDSATKKIIAHPSAIGFSKKDMEEAMQRLLDSGEIHIGKTDGPPSKQKDTLKIGQGEM